MKKILNKKYSILVIILLISLFLRGYDAIGRFGFAHDADLFSWVVKDIVIGHHFRLIGQETSTQGIFIGPLFYYLLIPFYLLTKMDPVGALGFSILIGMATVASFYFVFKDLFNQKAGLIAAFLQGVLLSRVGHDRWVVPTITDNLWEVWFFYCILKITQGDFRFFPLLGVLIGLIWHINFSLAPILMTVPVALYFSRKLPSIKNWFYLSAGFILSSLPLILFEIRHNLSQTKSLINSFFIYQGAERGFYRVIHVLDEATHDLASLFLYPSTRFFWINVAIFAALLLVVLFIVRKRIISKQIAAIFYIWIFAPIIFFALSSKILSEYYFSSIYMIFLSIAILFISSLNTKLVSAIFILLATYNSFHILTSPDYNNEGYLERKATVRFITEDSRSKGYPCVSVSYITNPGEDLGYRYLFYLANLHVNHSNSGSPNYTVVNPASLSRDSIRQQFGAIGIIPPKNIKVDEEITKSCSGENSNLTDSMFGFTE